MAASSQDPRFLISPIWRKCNSLIVDGFFNYLFTADSGATRLVTKANIPAVLYEKFSWPELFPLMNIAKLEDEVKWYICEKNVGRTDLVEHRIDTGDAKLIRQPPRRLSFVN